MKAFYIINDTSDIVIWDDLLFNHVPNFPTCPKGWKTENPKRHGHQTEGDWTMGCGMHQMASKGAYEKAGIPEPKFSQIPAVFCVTDQGVEGKYNVTAEQAAQFIRERI